MQLNFFTLFPICRVISAEFSDIHVTCTEFHDNEETTKKIIFLEARFIIYTTTQNKKWKSGTEKAEEDVSLGFQIDSTFFPLFCLTFHGHFPNIDFFTLQYFISAII
jgi:hypothetical protein